ncbi:MAG: TonB-dependent receptor [bacterium]|nr:TonB-dependent receptor [bacterium]
MLRRLLPLLCLIAALPAMAQSGALEIRVLDGQNAEALPGATVVVRNERGLSAETALVTDDDGVVRFPVLRSGQGYVVEVTFPGYGGQIHREVRVRIDETERLAIQLSPEIQERVRVVSTADVVDIEKTGTATRFSDDFIENLPVPGRFYQNLLTLAPGVKDSDGDGNPNVHGARARDFKSTVSGVSNVDPLTGQWLSYVNAESIEEIEVITAGAGVEFGRAQGGFARVIQKQGSNEFEGVFGFLYRSSLLDRNGASDTPVDEIPDFDWIQPSIQVSGAIVKDRVWYRLSHEYIKREDPVNVLTGVEITTREQSLNADQITWQTSPRNKLTFQWQNDPLTIENLDLSSSVRPESSRTLERGGPTYSLTWLATSSARLIVDTLVAYQDSKVDIVPSQPGIDQRCMIYTRYENINSARCLNTDTNQTSGSYFETSKDKRQRLTFNTQATWYAGRTFGASHRLKFGFGVENERYFRDLERGIDMQFFTEPSLFPQPPVFGVGTTEVHVPRESAASAAGNYWTLYVEDQIKPLDGLAITVGVRMDRSEVSSRGNLPFDPKAQSDAYLERFLNECTGGGNLGNCVRGIAADVFVKYENMNDFRTQLAEALGVPASQVTLSAASVASAAWPTAREADDVLLDQTTFSPRLSVAWDPWSDGKTKFAASVGRYYDKVFLAVPLVELEPVFTSFTQVGIPERGTFSPLIFSGRLDSINAAVNTRQISRDLKNPYQDELTISAERALWAETSIKLTYVQRKFRDQLQDIDINHGTGGVVFNPGWGQILLVGNFNESDYEGYVLELNRRQYRGWELQGSYTWSEAIGDAEDFEQLLGNNRDVQDDERGFLAFDQRHVVRVNAMTITPWGFRLGGTLRWESGLPYSLLHEAFFQFNLPPQYFGMGVTGEQQGFFYPTEQRNDQRNSSFWTFNVRLAKEFALRGGQNLQITGEIFNLLNDDTLRQLDRIDGVANGTRRFGRQYQIGLRLAF